VRDQTLRQGKVRITGGTFCRKLSKKGKINVPLCEVEHALLREWHTKVRRPGGVAHMTHRLGERGGPWEKLSPRPFIM